MDRRTLVAGVVLLGLVPGFAMAQDVERGRLLHENHCRMCHDSIAYKRDAKIAKNYSDVRAQVTRWQTNTGLGWSESDIDSVTRYVAQRYYKYPRPGEGK
ncbi:MAG: cytochrome C [Burkholderiales bacterium]|nr:cytochrome C [Burkholderiales bacterium]